MQKESADLNRLNYQLIIKAINQKSNKDVAKFTLTLQLKYKIAKK